jgi:hypothetical protein
MFSAFLQHFATKRCDFTVLPAVVVAFVPLAKIKIYLMKKEKSLNKN